MKLSALLEPMVARGVSGDVILEMVKAFEAEQGDALERRRATDRERQASKRHRDVSRDSRDSSTVTRTKRDTDDAKAEFAGIFWPAYPHKVAKADAEKKFIAARKAVGLDVIMSGLERYIQSKPVDRPWCNAATWLNQRRWEDQPAPDPRLMQVPSAKSQSQGARILQKHREKGEANAHRGQVIEGDFNRQCGFDLRRYGG